MQELAGLRVLLGVGLVHPVDAVLGHEYRLGADLQRPLGGRGVGREVRHPETRPEDHDAALLEVADGPARDVGLADLDHLDSRLEPGDHPASLQRVLERQRVDHRAEDAHVVATVAVHPDLGGRLAADDVAATYHDRDLDAELDDLGELTGDAVDLVEVQAPAGVVAGERLPRQLDQDAGIARFPGVWFRRRLITRYLKGHPLSLPESNRWRFPRAVAPPPPRMLATRPPQP